MSPPPPPPTSTPTPDAPPEESDGIDARLTAMYDDPRFLQLRRRLLSFIVPASLVFMAWYLLYVLMSAYARDVMATVLFGNVNVALVFGLLQFLSTFAIAIWYSRYAAREVDPGAEELRTEIDEPQRGEVA